MIVSVADKMGFVKRVYRVKPPAWASDAAAMEEAVKERRLAAYRITELTAKVKTALEYPDTADKSETA